MTTEFTPLASLLGGSLIGVSAVLLMLGLGRIMGATGLLAGAIFPHSLKTGVGGVMLFVAALITGIWLTRKLEVVFANRSTRATYRTPTS